MTKRRPAYLSKSRLLSARQCLKRVHLEVNRPELATGSPRAQAAFDTGHRVGEMARRIYGTADAVLIPYDGGLAHAVKKTARLLAEDFAGPIFEATFRHRGVLVRIDVLLPENGGWRIVEVKASTEVKDYHVFDCAVQSWVFRSLGHELSRVTLAHVDNSFVYPGGGDYQGLLIERNLDHEVEQLLPAVAGWVGRAMAAAGDPEPDVPVGVQCNRPFVCPFMDHCWPSQSRFPLRSLPRARLSTLAQFVAEGFTDVREVPAERLTGEQRRVRDVAVSGVAELLPGAADFIAALGFPRQYLDFETVAPAIPVWAGTRPYEIVPVQWSCHYEIRPGQLEHAEFLDLTGEKPTRRFAESLLRALSGPGPVLVYSSYERTVLNSLRGQFDDLDRALGAIVGRLVDLKPVTEQFYYHPDMAGSWSLKSVLPTVAANMSYMKLDGIQEGTAASEGYLEAIAETTTGERKSELRRQLLSYCKFDTEALYRLTQFLGSPPERPHS